MRQGSLSLLLALCLASPLLHAEEEIAAPTERQLQPVQASAENEPQRTEPGSREPAASAEQMQLAQLRQENRRLRIQLHEEQAKIQSHSQSQPQLLNEQQQWFAIGGGVGMLGFLLGVLTTRSGRRRQWLN